MLVMSQEPESSMIMTITMTMAMTITMTITMTFTMIMTMTLEMIYSVGEAHKKRATTRGRKYQLKYIKFQNIKT